VATKLLPQRELARIKLPRPPKDKALTPDNQNIKSAFTFLKRTRNPLYEEGLQLVPLRSCLLLNKSPVLNGKSDSLKAYASAAAAAAAAGPDLPSPVAWLVKTRPKWYTDLLRSRFEPNTGEITAQSVYRTDCLTQGNNRKIKAVNAFTKHFNPLYQRKKVTLLFYTFTVANQANVNISDCVKHFKKRLHRRGIKLHGFVWVLEVSDSLHVHYHALFAIDRINFKGSRLPAYLKLDKIWGARCQVEAVRSSVRSYLSKYFVKAKNRIVGKRQFGKSIPKN
jgi:hypothetical protein